MGVGIFQSYGNMWVGGRQRMRVQLLPWENVVTPWKGESFIEWWRVSIPREKGVRPGMKGRLIKRGRVGTHTVGSSSRVGPLNHDLQIVLRRSYVSQRTLRVKSCKFTKHRQTPDSLPLFQVHVELFISIKFMGIVARGTICVVDAYAIGANVVSWVGVRSKKGKNREKILIKQSERRNWLSNIVGFICDPVSRQNSQYLLLLGSVLVVVWLVKKPCNKASLSLQHILTPFPDRNICNIFSSGTCPGLPTVAEEHPSTVSVGTNSLLQF